MIDRKLLKIVGLIFVGIILIYIFYNCNIFEYIKDREKLEVFIRDYGVAGEGIYIGIYIICTLLCISVLPVTLAGALIFGIIRTILITIVSASIGLSLSFLISRYILKKPLEKKFREHKIYRKIDEGVEKQGWFIVAITRIVPIFPFGIQNYVYGLTNISFMLYWFFSTLFLIPGIVFFIVFSGVIISGDVDKMLKVSILSFILFIILLSIIKIVSKKLKEQKGGNATNI